ncbi:MAG: hypothetical protein R3B48_30395 [Kofleriaceae bacterium]
MKLRGVRATSLVSPRWRLVWIAFLASSWVACGSDKTSLSPDGAALPDGASPPPSVGTHAIVFQRLNGGLSTLSTPALATTATGSTLVVSVGRGDFSAFAAPTDNKANTYQQLGVAHTYTRYPSSGTAVYAVANGAGGPGHVISATTPPSDEITLAAVEVKGTRVADFQWSEVLMDRPITSEQVTTTGPATLVAFWWGDAGVNNDKTAVPNNGFTVIDSVLSSGELVQSAVAVKAVSAAGTYDVTWTATPVQGAQLWLVAIE